MSIRILTKNAVENTNIDGARQNHFNSGMQSGVVKGAFNEGNIFSPALNAIAIDSCELRISGHQIVIDSAEYITLNDKPYDAKRLSLIAQIKVTEFSEPEFEFIVQAENVKLIQDNLFENERGNGIYQLKLCNFTLGTDGVIRNVIKVVETITGGTNSAVKTDIEFTATATELSASSQPEAVITYNHETGTYDLVFGIPRGGGTDVQVGGISQGILRFDSDPQQQLDTLNAKIGTASSFKVEIVDELPTENISTSTFYLIKSKTEGENIYNEYLYVNGVWEALGTTSIEAYDDTELRRLIESKADKSALENLSNLVANKVDTTTFNTETARLQAGIKDNTDEILEIQNAGYITKEVNNLTNYTKSSDLSKVATSNDYNDLDNKPTMPTKLPTPNKLTIKVTDQTPKYFDGSEAVEVNIDLPNVDGLVDIVNGHSETLGELAQQDATLQGNIDKKQDKITDLATIRSGASAGATALQDSDLDDYYDKTEIDNKLFTKADNSNLQNYALKSALNDKADKTELASYYTKTDADTLLNKKVDKVDGWGLSQNNFTNTEKTKLSKLESADNYYIKSEVNTLLAGKVDDGDLDSYYTKTDTNTLLKNKADTTALNSYYTKTQTDSLVANKIDRDALDSYYTESEVNTLLSGKVDKVTGKGLSTNDYTTADMNKLAGLSNYDDTAVRNLIAGKVDKTTTINKKALSGNITLTASDVGALPSTTTLFSGNYNDLTNKPTIPTTAGQVGALPDTTKYGATLSLTMNTSTYVVTAQLKDQAGNNLGTAQTIDLPLESVVVSGSYDATNKKVILTLKDGSTIDFSVADLVSGLVQDARKVAGIDLKDDITTTELSTALNLSQYANKVTSVNGKTGAVSLVAGDVGALPNTTVVPKLYNDLGENTDGAIDQATMSTFLTNLDEGMTMIYNEASSKYAKPSTGIPKTDLASNVQTSLGKADTALQSIPAEYVTETELSGKGYATTSAMNNAISSAVSTKAEQSDLDEISNTLTSVSNTATSNSTKINNLTTTVSSNYSDLNIRVVDNDKDITNLQNNKANITYVDEEIERVEGLITAGGGTKVTIGGSTTPPVATLNFDSDPQTQINTLSTNVSNAVTIGDTQTISGQKTFSSNLTYFTGSLDIEGNVTLKNNATLDNSTANTLKIMGSNTILLHEGSTTKNGLEVGTSSISPYLANPSYNLGYSSRPFANLYLGSSGKIYKGSNTLTLPSSAGTLALTTDIPDVSNLASKSEIPDISNLATKDEIPTDYVTNETYTSGLNTKADKTTVSQISNPNILINGDFRIDQRAKTTYSAEGYTVDRWKKATYGTVTKTDNGIDINASNGRVYLVQRLEESAILVGKTVTLSVCLNDGTIYSATETLQAVANSYAITYFSWGNVRVYYYSSTGHFAPTIDVSSGQSVSIKWIKLEYGSVATPFIPRLYAEELLLCQRYYVGIPATCSNGLCGYTVAAGDYANIQFFTPTTMRIVPTISVSTLPSIRYTGSTFSVTSVSVLSRYNNCVPLKYVGSFGKSVVVSSYGLVGSLDAEI